jgi:hypothetical protein
MRVLDAVEDENQGVLYVLQQGGDVAFIVKLQRPKEVGVTWGAIVAPGHGLCAAG